MVYFSVRELGARGEPENPHGVLFFAGLIGRGGHLAAIQRAACGRFAIACCCSVSLEFRHGRATGHDARLFPRQDLMSAALAYSTVIFSSLFGMLLWGGLGRFVVAGHPASSSLQCGRHILISRPSNPGRFVQSPLQPAVCR